MIKFTAHNVVLQDGQQTFPNMGKTMDQYGWFLQAKRLLDLIFPTKNNLKLVDLGCLEGGYATEFARLGCSVTGIEIRQDNFEACEFVKSNVENTLDLNFFQDNVWNVEKYGDFDVTFCCEIFYHVHNPKKFMQLLSRVTKKLIIIQTHFSSSEINSNFALSPTTTHEGLEGRWFIEFPTDVDFANRESFKWASWDTNRSFWLTKESLLKCMKDAGFDLVFEQFDGLGEDIAKEMKSGYYKTHQRGTFVGIKLT